MRTIGTIFFAALLHTVAIAQAQAQGVLYVDDSAPLGGDGTSWNTAFRHLQDALTSAREQGGVTEIRIGQGTYRPDLGVGFVPGDKASVFDIVSGIAMRGGYAGLGTNNPDDRDWFKFQSVLSGDLLGNDGPAFSNYQENSWNLVNAQTTAAGTLLEGLTLTAVDDEGDLGSSTAAVMMHAGALVIRDCRFVRNLSYFGGGIIAMPTEVSGYSLLVQACSFEDNHASDGGTIAVFGDPVANVAVIEDCQFTRSTTGNSGTGGAIKSGADVTIRRCIFDSNHADVGAAIRGSDSMTVQECTFTDHTATMGAVFGGGSYFDCVFADNFAGFEGGAYTGQLSNGIPQARFVRCVFLRNRCGSNRGGAAYGGASFVACHFFGNRSGISGGGQFGPGGAIATRGACEIVDCVFAGNQASGAGGAIHADPIGPVEISGCSFSGNSTPLAGAAIAGTATICNSVFGPHAGTLLSGVTSVDYSGLPIAWPGAGNIVAADPGFVNPLGPDGIPGTEDDDLRLRPDSPCIDAGNSNVLPPDAFDIDGDGNLTEPLPLDAFGNARILETPGIPNTGIPPLNGGPAVIDMGAHEYRRPADIAPAIGDGAVNVNDLLEVITNWGPCPPSPRGAPCHADIDGNGEVAVWDLIQVIINWG